MSQMSHTNLMLMLMSFSYALLNLPYCISWLFFFYDIIFVSDIHPSTTQSRTEVDPVSSLNNSLWKNYIFGSKNLAEIFYVLNYGINFFVYCASGEMFRKQLKESLKCK
jgi:hypothetical protein